MASLILHGIALGAVACLAVRYPASALPVFQPGEFSLEFAPVQPAAPAGAVAPLPPPAPEPQPAEIEEEEEEKEKEEAEEPLEIADAPEEEESDEFQLMADLPSVPAPARVPAPVPVPQPAAPAPAAAGHPGRQAHIAAGPVSGAASPGLAGGPRLAANIHPVYPPGARRRGEEGIVAVRAAVTAAGKAETAAVVSSSGYPALDQAALDAVRRARFIPASDGWTPVASQTVLTFRFTLVD